MGASPAQFAGQGCLSCCGERRQAVVLTLLHGMIPPSDSESGEGVGGCQR